MITVFKQHLNLITEYNGIEGRKFYKIRKKIFFSFCQKINFKYQTVPPCCSELCSFVLLTLSVRPS